MTAPSGGPLLSSEQALEKLFRANYNRWVEDAKKRLGKDNEIAAPRVVSKAFHMAWTDRQRLHSQDELDAFLGANIQHGAARELSRKASAARMAHGEGHKEVHDQHMMTVDEAWEGLKRTLSGGEPAEANRKRASAARHEAAEGFNKIAAADTFNWKPLVAIVAIGLALGIGGFMYVDKAGADRAVTHALNAQDARPYETSFGQQANVTLDDSTVVRIGPETKLIVPKMFNIELRAVRIDGTANFDVRTTEMPFEVRSGDVAIIAQGGQFTVRRFKDDAAMVVHARKGALDVKFGEVTRNVAEGFSLMVSSTGEMTVPSADQLGEASSWVDGNVSIEGRTLKDALPQLKRWYGLDIKVPDASLLDRKVFIRAKLGSSKEAIAAVEQSGGVKFTYIGDNMAFQDTLPSRGRRTKGR